MIQAVCCGLSSTVLQSADGGDIVRFGKRNKSRSFLNRQNKNKNKNKKNGALTPVASEERNALLSNDNDPLDAIPDDPPPIIESADPTQRLLTLLGRFQRYVSKAESGAPQEAWSDSCMEQLIIAVEISIEQDWVDVTEALTDTARILQSYEDASKANDCISFLKGSYELLCLMVGDLIVDNVRSGVIEKWRELYNNAAKDVAAAGIRLIADEEENEEVETDNDIGIAETTSPEDRFVESPFDLPQEQSDDEVPEDTIILPSLDELPPLEEAINSTSNIESDLSDMGMAEQDYLAKIPEDNPDLVVQEYEEALAQKQKEEESKASNVDLGTSPEIASTLDSICEQLGQIESAGIDDRVSGIEAIEDGLATLKCHAHEKQHPEAEAICFKMAQLCSLACSEKYDIEDKFLELAFAFCGIYVEAGNEPDSIAVNNWMFEADNLAKRWSFSEVELDTLDSVPEKVTELSHAIDDSAISDDESIDTGFVPGLEPAMSEASIADIDPLAYDEMGISMETPADSHTDEDLEESTAEAFDLAEVPQADEEPEIEQIESVDVLEFPSDKEDVAVDETLEPEESEVDAASNVQDAVSSVDDSLESLFETAKRAMASGDTAYAKLIALQVAANIANADSEKAQKRVYETEERIKHGNEAIEQARDIVRTAENVVLEAEQAVADGLAALEENRIRVNDIDEELNKANNRIADLDEQILRLQEKRDDESKNADGISDSLEQQKEVVQLKEEELESLKEHEEETRAGLEDSRQDVKRLQHKRSEIELDMDKAREVLSRQRSSFSDIEQTISQIKSNDGDGESESELLF